MLDRTDRHPRPISNIHKADLGLTTLSDQLHRGLQHLVPGHEPTLTRPANSVKAHR